MSVAAGSGRIHDGLKFCIVLRLGTTDDFKPDGANMIKLCANDGFVGLTQRKTDTILRI